MSPRFSPVVAILALASCSSPKEQKAGVIAAIASGSLALRALIPESSVTAPPAKPLIVRPQDAADLIVSAEKRARVERLVPEAKGFLTSAALETELYKLELRRGKDGDAVKAFDQLAKGKWVLFTGNVGALGPHSCELPIRYTPKDPNDALGLTSVWIPIELSGIKGYDMAAYTPGQLAVIVARYDGQRKAGAGYDVVLLQSWFEK